MAKQPLVSVIVPTKNSAATLRACLRSIESQTYKKRIELIVVDNPASTDSCEDIAKIFTSKLYFKGPERCAQRNYGASKANGDIVIFIDSDMELGPKVVEQCVAALEDPEVQGVVIHEESFGEGFWAQCKALERSYYVNVPWIEAARAFHISTFREIGGYDTSMVSGEDWDLSKRAERHGTIVAIDEFIRHNEGELHFSTMMKKKYYYAQHAAAYLKANPDKKGLNSDVGPLNRYKLFFSDSKRLTHEPMIGAGMLFLKTAEFGAGAVGYFKSH